MNYTARALAESSISEATDIEACPPGSRADFVQALRILSTATASRGYRFDLGDREIEDLQVVYLRCPYETWLTVFGKPRNIEKHSESAPMFPVEAWEYRCVDGPVRCVGHQVDDLYGKRWVTFVRLCYF
jgi:hypothetical protein